MNYNSRILKSSNNNKTTWDIKILETGKNVSNRDIGIGYQREIFLHPTSNFRCLQ